MAWGDVLPPRTRAEFTDPPLGDPPQSPEPVRFGDGLPGSGGILTAAVYVSGELG